MAFGVCGELKWKINLSTHPAVHHPLTCVSDSNKHLLDRGTGIEQVTEGWVAVGRVEFVTWVI